uniref:Uncharacterized protein MANES_14G125700 n=1 Tax=Rhizophora mucronata TaxID=61149 RepID=A0A2P2L9A5_RHIMU
MISSAFFISSSP